MVDESPMQLVPSEGQVSKNVRISHEKTILLTSVEDSDFQSMCSQKLAGIPQMNANQHFKNGLTELNISKFDVKSHENVDFKVLETIFEAQKKTLDALIQSDLILDGNFVNARQSVLSITSYGTNDSKLSAYGLKDKNGKFVQ